MEWTHSRDSHRPFGQVFSHFENVALATAERHLHFYAFRCATFVDLFTFCFVYIFFFSFVESSVWARAFDSIWSVQRHLGDIKSRTYVRDGDVNYCRRGTLELLPLPPDTCSPLHHSYVSSRAYNFPIIIIMKHILYGVVGTIAPAPVPLECSHVCVLVFNIRLL